MDEMRDTDEQRAREAWIEPKLVVVDISSATEAFNGGAGDSNTGS